MVQYSVKTKRSAEEVISKAVAYFSGNLGLTITEQTPCCVRFTGGGGFVNVSVDMTDGTAEVAVETREWEYQARDFIQKIA